MGRAAAVLSPARSAALAALGAGVVAYYVARESLPWLPLWGDVTVVALGVMPAVFGLEYLALPLRRAGNALLVAALACAVLAIAFSEAHVYVGANFAKLVAMTCFGWWFLRYFEDVSWIVLVALIIPVVDSLSVWRGPTHTIVTHRRHVFNALSFAFPVPGKPPNGAVCTGGACDMQLGLPDLLFFALFLAAAARWRLRTFWTWLALTASFGLTLTLAVGFSVGGLPALPLLAAGFLLPNVDLLWTRLRARIHTR